MSLVIRSFTIDRHGLSCVAQLIINNEADIVKLIYIYSLQEEFKAGEGAQQGAAELHVIGEHKDQLRGEYWTNTKTSGRLILKRCTLDHVDTFKAATLKWPKEEWISF